MQVRRLRAAAIVVALAFLASPFLAALGDEPTFSRDEMRRFLLTARVVASRQTNTGVTRPWHLTLSDGTLTHDALFQAVDEREPLRKFDDGRVEVNFVDSYRYDLAADALGSLLGLEDMMALTVERKWNGRKGALSWWLPVKMDERARLAQHIEPPPGVDWNAQMYKVRVFSALVYDTDRNLTNILISNDWHIWMIDFTRAFRLARSLPPGADKDLVKCDRKLLAALQALTREDVERGTKDQLSKKEVDALMARRDLILEHFAALVAKQGDAAVLY
jgi:hypothetical protein